MSLERIELIKESFKDLGPKLGQAYSNKEIIDGSIDLQGAIAKDFASRMHISIERDRDVLTAIENVVTMHGLNETEEYQRFRTNITELGFTIGSFIKGLNGEKIAKRALKLISFDKDVRVLYNIALEDEDTQAEYDAIVIAPYGIFIIEVKNWAASMVINERGLLQREDGIDIMYDLPGRMSIKEGLLREYLGDLFATECHGIVLFSNSRAKVQDNYRKIPLSFGGSIVYDIRAYAKEDNNMNRDQINKIVDILMANNKEQKTINKVDSDAIIEDYATLVIMIEMASEAAHDTSPVEENTLANEGLTANDTVLTQMKSRKTHWDQQAPSVGLREHSRKLDWLRAASAASFIAATGISMLTMAKAWRI